MNSDLAQTAYTLAVEVRDGRWDHVKSIHVRPVPACAEIIAELRRRAPGHTTEEYQAAIAKALFASR